MKLISLHDALNLVQNGCNIVTGLGAAEARAFMGEVHTLAGKVKDISITNCLPMGVHAYMNEEFSDTFRVNGWFYCPALRDAHPNGNISFIPNHLHLAGVKRLAHMRPTIYIGAATKPDRHGYVSLSVSNTYERKMVDAADIVILEINPNYPRTFGDVELSISKIDYAIEVDYPVPVLPDAVVSDKDKKIGGYIAEHINDGDCIQLGIGKIPNAVAEALAGKKDLGVHTEMLTSGLMKLAKQGVITGERKNLHRGKMVATFILGTQELYDFANDNPAVCIMDGFYVNNPSVIGKNDNQVSINTTLEIDLTGQCCSESIGPRQFSGTGGQADTAIGAQRAKNGRSFIALYSTAQVKNAEGERVPISTIVPMLKQGAAVSLSRNDVDFVVTEYGVAALRGTSIQERAERLINVAHPDYREELAKTARELMYL
ncbi:MAG: 4-hydroxybutyrate--acetyl-CoA CoA transferase [Defluviitaleaceae bacterium]|nr:4-hydroxybutyrate--acetyl-CoA CoA transferase [Defluviitaleaceae bacterium]MCL2273874.1 4-hydroxybutyrate--acetyl-CoA CoA transferase [Defluviitaleaceae bacterium]